MDRPTFASSSPARFADHFRLSGYFVRIPGEGILRERLMEQLSAKFDDLRKEVLALKTQIADVPPHPVPSVPKVPPPPSPAPVPPYPQQPPVPSTPSLDSQIISDITEIFAEFRKFSLLWRGSRDGFKAQEVHRRCDGHANTLTVFLDTEGNIFGAFTPLEWESRKWKGKWKGKGSNCLKADDSQKSFLFTLKNPHNIPARRFALKTEWKHRAILCVSGYGPRFWDIGVNDNCTPNTEHWAFLNGSYTDDTVVDSNTSFTGSDSFQIKEIAHLGLQNGRADN
jgi:hypothetical protein